MCESILDTVKSSLSTRVLSRFHPADVAEQAAAFDTLAMSRAEQTTAFEALVQGDAGGKRAAAQVGSRKRRRAAGGSPEDSEVPGPRLQVVEPEGQAIEPEKQSAEPEMLGADPAAGDEEHQQLLEDFLQGYEQDEFFSKSENTEGLSLRHGLYWKRLLDGTEVLVVPDAVGLRKRCIQECHDAPYAGHAGMHKTYRLLQRTYWWPDPMRADVERFVRTCVPCQRNKASNQAPAGLLRPIPIPGRRWEVVTLDLITGIPPAEEGNDAIAVFVES